MTNTISLTNPLINGGTPVKLFNAAFSYTWTNKVTADPVPGSFTCTETQFIGWENPGYALTFYIRNPESVSGFMTWTLWNQFVRSQYLGSSSTRTLLTLSFGSSSIPFTSYASSSLGTSTIPITIKGFSLSVDPAQSLQGYVMIINAQLLESS